jgi:predicted permease
MRHFIRDLRHAWRGFWRTPVFTTVAVLSIALGIGANTAIFTLVDQILLRSLPVRNPEQLILFNGARNHIGSNSGGNMLSFPMYEDFRDNFVEPADSPRLPRVSVAVPNPAPTPKIFSGMFARRSIAMNVGVNGQTDRVIGELVSGTYFQVLGVGAALGRVLTPDDDKTRGEGYAAVLSYGYWIARFAGDRSVLNQRITINDKPFTIVGVSAAGFDGLDIGEVPSVRVPVMLKAQMTPNWDDMDNRRSRWVNVFARVKPGVTQAQALAILQPYFHGLLEQEAQMLTGATPYTRDQFLKGQMGLLAASQGRSPLRRQLADPLVILFAIVCGVLLIACANVASLLIARAAARQKEIAVRLAIGASRGRIVSQLLIESVLLAGLGGVLGLGLAALTTRFLLGFMPANTPHVIDAAINLRVLFFTFLLALVTGALFGLVPALRSTRPQLAPTLKDQVGAVVGGSGGVRIRKALVVAQVTISVLLLIGAGLFIRSLRNLRLLDLGLRPENLIAFNLDPTLGGYTSVKAKQFDSRLAERIRALPGVSTMAFARVGLFEGSEWDSSISIQGYQAKPGENMNPFCNAVSPGYFRTLGMRLIEGRDFDEHDARYEPVAPNAPVSGYLVAIVSESYAKHFFGARSPLGAHIGFGMNPGTKTPIEIVGVVSDAKYTGVRDDVPWTVYFPFLQNDNAGNAVMYVRTSNPSAAALGSIREVMRQLDSSIPMYDLRTLESQVDESLLNDRLIATLATAFGILATALAMVGLYGVMAYTVARRTREIGLRMALGAVRGHIIWMVMREVVMLVATGLAIGLVGAWALHKYVTSLLYGLGPGDPLAIAAAAIVLGLTAIAAAYVPAVRAMTVNPMSALRYE